MGRRHALSRRHLAIRRAIERINPYISEQLEQRLLLAGQSVVGTAVADQAILRLDPAGTTIQVFLNHTTAQQPDFQAPKAAFVDPLIIDLGGGDDILTIDLSNGSPLPLGGLTIIGGQGNDTLKLIGTASDDQFVLQSSSISVNGSQVPLPSDVEGLQFDGAAGNNALLVSSGTHTITADLGTGGSSMSLSLSGSSIVNFVGRQHLASLSLAGTSRLNLDAVRGHTLIVGALSLADSSRLDLNQNDLIVGFSSSNPRDTLRQYVNNWLGNIPGPALMASGSGSGSSQFLRSLSIGSNTALAFDHFDGQNFPAGDHNQILIKFTYLGDANLDGLVTPRDYAIVDGNIGLGQDWGTGDLNGDGKVTPTDYAQIDGNIGAGNGTAPGGPALVELPQLVAALSHDSGISSSDHLTNDPSIGGTLTGGGSLYIGLDGSAQSSYVSVASNVQADGSFHLDQTLLGPLFGPALSDGAHTLHLLDLDETGQVMVHADVLFTLDTTPPISPVFDLDLAYVSSAGPGTTTFRAPSVSGTTEAGAQLSLGNVVVTADASGSFMLPNAVLAVGVNQVTLAATDLAGNTSTSIRQITRIAPSTANQVALDWNNATLSAIQLDASSPPVASRALAITSAAMYDAVNAVNGASSYLFVHIPAPAGSSDIAAVAQAAHDALVYLYPAQQASFDSLLSQTLAAVPGGASKTNGINVGKQVAAAIIAQRKDDGATGYVDYTPGTGDGVWQPTYPTYAPAMLPNWATLQPFLMTSDSQFRPSGPTALDSAQWIADYNQVKNLGSATSTSRTADQTQIARFWADGAGTITPAGHWNQIATQLLAAKGNVSLFDTLRLLAELNVTMGDAAIVTWDAKYTDNFWRPITAIQAGGGNASLAADPNWVPLLPTPNFPEYVSGHSTFSAAAAVILGSYFGQNFAFSTSSPSPGVGGVVRSYGSFMQAAQEAAMSRIYAGIHYLTSANDGLAAGTALGQYILQRFADSSDTTAPAVSYSSPKSAAVKANTTISGLVTDNLSGVKSLKGQFDNGTSFDVPVDASGLFAVQSSFPLNGSADGTHVLHLTATDYAGNVSSSTDYSFALDTQAPSISLTSPAGTQPITLDITSTLSGTALGTGSPVISLSYRFDSGTIFPILFSATDGSFSQVLDLSKVSAGPHTLSITAQDAAGNTSTTSLNVTLPSAIPLTISDYAPTAGASDVGSTFRPKIVFSRPIDTSTLNSSNFFATDTTGAKLPATIVPASDGTYAWLFLTSPMPGASTITVTVDGTTIKAADGIFLDAANTSSQTGSKLTFSFSTVSTALLPGTSLSGILADPGPDLKPGTPDDVRSGPDGVLMTADDIYKLPIAGVTVSIAGTNLTAITGADGKFFFPSVPSGDVKLVANGNTSTNAPAGFYFPEMVMDLNIQVGQANTVMAAMARSGTGNSQPGAVLTTAPGVYLPRLQTSLLQTVSSGNETHITVSAVNAPDLTQEQRSSLTLDVPANSMIGMDGQPLASAQIGISTVDPSLVMDMLPPGVMQHTFDITIQAPGVATFSVPVPLTSPNVFSGAPGTKLNLLSFDHTTGRLVIEGTGTISADGLSVATDPGIGITHPGWHGWTPPGFVVSSPPDAPPCDDDDDNEPDDEDLAAQIANCFKEFVAEELRDEAVAAACKLLVHSGALPEEVCMALCPDPILVPT